MLVPFELKKVVKNRFFGIALCLILFANLVLNCGLRPWHAYCLKMQEFSGDVPGFLDYISEERKETRMVESEYSPFVTMSQEEKAAFEASMEAAYGKDVFSPDFELPSKSFSAHTAGLGDEISDGKAIIRYSSLRDVNAKQQKSIDLVLESAKEFGRDALASGNHYEIRRNLDIIRLYSKPAREISSTARGWDEFLFDSPMTMALTCLMILLASVTTFSGELERGTWLILHTAKNGKRKTMLAKYLAAAIIAAGIMVLMELTSAVGVCIQGGFFGGEQPVTALPQLHLCPWHLTILQYAAIQMTFRLLTAVLFSILICSISALSPSDLVSYSAGVLFLGACLLPTFLPPESELLTGPLTLAQPLRLFRSYATADIVTFPIPWLVVHLVVWVVLTAAAVWLADRIYHRERKAV